MEYFLRQKARKIYTQNTLIELQLQAAFGAALCATNWPWSAVAATSDRTSPGWIAKGHGMLNSTGHKYRI